MQTLTGSLSIKRVRRTMKGAQKVTPLTLPTMEMTPPMMAMTPPTMLTTATLCLPHRAEAEGATSAEGAHCLPHHHTPPRPLLPEDSPQQTTSRLRTSPQPRQSQAKHHTVGIRCQIFPLVQRSPSASWILCRWHTLQPGSDFLLVGHPLREILFRQEWLSTR